MALQGTLDTFALPDVLRLLAATRKTGRLLITGAPGRGSAWVDDGSIVGVEAEHAPHATAAVDALFELLRFQDGAFTFEADVEPESPDAPMDPEALVTEAEGLLSEWREIERVVPSTDAWVTLRRVLAGPEVTIGQELWTTIVAIGGGATVRTMCDDLRQAELPMSRSVRDLCDLGLVDIEPSLPAGRAEPSPQTMTPESDGSPAEVEEPTVVSETTSPRVVEPAALPEPADMKAPAAAAADPGSTHDAPVSAQPATAATAMDDVQLPTARPLRPRRTKGAAHLSSDVSSGEPERFVPLDLPGQGAQLSYDPIIEPTSADDAPGEGDGPTEGDSVGRGTDATPAALPGLSAKVPGAQEDDGAEEPVRRLAPLGGSAGGATTEDDPGAPAEPGSSAGGAGEPSGRGLLVKLRSAAKG